MIKVWSLRLALLKGRIPEISSADRVPYFFRYIDIDDLCCNLLGTFRPPRELIVTYKYDDLRCNSLGTGRVI